MLGECFWGRCDDGLIPNAGEVNLTRGMLLVLSARSHDPNYDIQLPQAYGNNKVGTRRKIAKLCHWCWIRQCASVVAISRRAEVRLRRSQGGPAMTSASNTNVPHY